MTYTFKARPIINKANKSIVINPPKKRLPKELIEK
jgi:hypothetical protein